MRQEHDKRSIAGRGGAAAIADSKRSSSEVPLPKAIALLGVLAVGAILLLSHFFRGPDTSGSNQGFKSFANTTRELSIAVLCEAPKITPADVVSGALYGCIMGSAQTAKLWVNEKMGAPGSVENVKVMWNDWTKDTGYGVHSDQAEAEHMVRVVSRTFVPKLESILVQAFRGNTPMKVESGPFDVEYRLTPGPAIDEHLLIISRGG